MPTISLSIPADKLSDVVAAFKSTFPIPLVNGDPQYTDQQWVKERMKYYVREIVARHKRHLKLSALAFDECSDVIS